MLTVVLYLKALQISFSLSFYRCPILQHALQYLKIGHWEQCAPTTQSQFRTEENVFQ